jgi:hypothetical protein
MPQFTKGQKVQAILSTRLKGITAGNTYTIDVVWADYSKVGVTNDHGVRKVCEAGIFKAIPETNPTLAGKRWMISLIEQGVLKPAREPRQYASEKQAHAVAKEMAEKHRGSVFVVFEATGFTFVPTSTETVVHAL